MFFVFCFLFTDAIKIQVTEKTNIFAQEESSIEKTLPAKVESLLMKHFDLNQTQKKCSQKSVQYRTSAQCADVIFALKLLRETLKI